MSSDVHSPLRVRQIHALRRLVDAPMDGLCGRVTFAQLNAAQEQAVIGKHNRVGIPTTAKFDGEIPLPHLKVPVGNHQNNPYGIQ
jgi:hypothetical protein